LKLLLAIDSFKESLSSLEAAAAFEKGFGRILPKTKFDTVSISDGGEGFSDSFIHNCGGRKVSVKVHDPLHRPIKTNFALIDHGRKAVVEMAAASGLPLLKQSERNPLLTSTFGTGELIRRALDFPISELIVGIGGSATNDGGAGMAQALGVKFYDLKDRLITAPLCGGMLLRIGRIDSPALLKKLRKTKVTVACDVDNPLTGKAGAAAIYGPQKGATPRMVQELDAGLHHYAALLKRDLGISIEKIPGAGAAGGLGGGLMAFLGAELLPGIQIMLSESHFQKRVRKADFVITGEGQMDGQTIRNKAPRGVARIAKKEGVPVIAVCGRVGEGAEALYSEGISAILSIVKGPCDLQSAIKSGAVNMERTAETIARILQTTGTP